MLSATLQHVGTKYLQMTLRRIVHEVCMSNPRLEIDPLKYVSLRAVLAAADTDARGGGLVQAQAGGQLRR
jgi:hypothetical protein